MILYDENLNGMDLFIMNDPPEYEDMGDGADDGGMDGDGQESEDTGLMLKTRPKTKKPAMYKVLLLNED